MMPDIVIVDNLSLVHRYNMYIVHSVLRVTCHKCMSIRYQYLLVSTCSTSTTVVLVLVSEEM